MPLLSPGDTFPDLTLAVPGGKTVRVPETFAGQYGVMLLSVLTVCASPRLVRLARRSARSRNAGRRRRRNGR